MSENSALLEQSKGSPFIELDSQESLPVHSQKSTATRSSSVLNLTNTILGAGLLSMPHAMAGVGLGLGVGLVALFGLAAVFGLLLLYDIASLHQPPHSFYKLANNVFSSPFWVDVAIAIKCFGVGVSYLIICGDLIPVILMSFGVHGLLLSRTFWITLCLALISPFAYASTLHSLRYTSGVALLAVAYLFFIVTSYCLFPASSIPFPDLPALKWFHIDSTFFKHVPLFIFAFTCHQNLFSIVNELRNPSPPRMAQVIWISVGASFLVYLFVGVFGVLTFGASVKPNIIQQYPPSPIITGGQISIILLVLLSYPLQLHPCRASCLSLINELKLKKAIPETVNHDSIESEDINPHETTQQTPSRNMFLSITTCILLISLITTVMVSDLTTVLAFVGATGSTTICYILPGCLYVKNRWKNGDGWTVKIVGACMLSIMGVFIMFISLGTQLMGFVV